LRISKKRYKICHLRKYSFACALYVSSYSIDNQAFNRSKKNTKKRGEF